MTLTSYSRGQEIDKTDWRFLLFSLLPANKFSSCALKEALRFPLHFFPNALFTHLSIVWFSLNYSAKKAFWNIPRKIKHSTDLSHNLLWMLCVVQVEVPATARPVFQRSPTESLFVHELIRCNRNTLYIHWVGRRGRSKKEIRKAFQYKQLFWLKHSWTRKQVLFKHTHRYFIFAVRSTFRSVEKEVQVLIFL